MNEKVVSTYIALIRTERATSKTNPAMFPQDNVDIITSYPSLASDKSLKSL